MRPGSEYLRAPAAATTSQHHRHTPKLYGEIRSTDRPTQRRTDVHDLSSEPTGSRPKTVKKRAMPPIMPTAGGRARGTSGECGKEFFRHGPPSVVRGNAAARGTKELAIAHHRRVPRKMLKTTNEGIFWKRNVQQYVLRQAIPAALTHRRRRCATGDEETYETIIAVPQKMKRRNVARPFLPKTSRSLSLSFWSPYSLQ